MPERSHFTVRYKRATSPQFVQELLMKRMLDYAPMRLRAGSTRFEKVVAIVGLMVVAAGASLPHQHSDNAFSASPSIRGEQVGMVACSGRAAGATHLHAETLHQIDACIACFLQHFRSTSAHGLVFAPRPFQIARADRNLGSKITNSARRSRSRAPPARAI